MTKFFRLRPYLAFLCLAFTGCVDSDEYEVKGITAKPSITLPLAYGNLGIQDFLSSRDSSYIRVDSDGLYYLFYEQTLKSPDIRNLIQIPDRVFSRSVPMPPSIQASTTEQPFTTALPDLNFNFDPENIDVLLLKKGKVKLNVSITPLPQPAGLVYDVIVKLPDFTLPNGTPFSQQVAANGEIDLTGYTAKFTNDQTRVELTVVVKPHTGTIITAGKSVKVDFSFEGLDFEFMEGFFGQQVANIPSQSISVDPFNPADTGNGTVSIAQPRLSFIVTNEYGIPVNVNFVTLEARKTGSSSLPVQLDVPNLHNIDLPFPTVSGTTKDRTFSVQNAKQLLSYSPDEFFYQIDALTNKGLVSGNNFCADTATLNVSFRAEVPLYGTASGLVLSDTTDLDIGDLENSEVESLFIKVKISNQLPLDAYFQLYLADENGQVIEPIFTDKEAEDIVPPSKVNAAGELVSPGVYDSEIAVAKNKIDKIFSARKLILLARMHTIRNADGTQPDVKFKAGYTMDVKLGIRAELNVKADL